MRSRQFSFAAQSVSSAAFPLLAPSGTAAAPSYSFTAGYGMFFETGIGAAISYNATSYFAVTNASVSICNGASLGFDASLGGTGDVFLKRVSAAVLSLQNSTAAQEWRVYGTTTGPKYASLSHNGTITILADSGGSGVRVSATGANLGFYGTAPIALQTSTAATATALRTVLINLGLCS